MKYLKMALFTVITIMTNITSNLLTPSDSLSFDWSIKSAWAYFVNGFFNMSFWVILSLALGIYVYFKCRSAGERKIMINPFFYYYKFFRIPKFVHQLHEFQHIYTSCAEASRESDNSPENFKGLGETLLEKLLLQIQTVYKSLFGVSPSIQVKVFLNEDMADVCDVSDTYLETIAKTFKEDRGKAKYIIRENLIFHKKKYGKARSIEKPCLRNGYSPELKSWIDFIKDSIDREDLVLDEGDLLNSAFLYVLGDDNHFFISNDLTKEEGRGLFFNAKDEWKKHYNSIGVFLICPKVNAYEAVDINKPLGLLILDSRKRYIFESEISKKLIGYFAHRLYNYLEYYYPSTSNSEHYG